MKDETNRNPAHERVWRQELTPADLARAAQLPPAGREELALENSLTAALRRLPETRVSSNFTSRVVQALELEHTRAARRSAPGIFVFRWLPRFATVCAIAIAVLVGHQWIETRRAEEMARSVARIPAASLPPDILEDFDAIQVMSRTPSADVQLLALME